MSKKTDEADLVSRDERHDSIDPATGTLTEEAVALRAKLATGEEVDPVEAEVDPVEANPVEEPAQG